MQDSAALPSLCTSVEDVDKDEGPPNLTPDWALSPILNPLDDKDGWESDISNRSGHSDRYDPVHRYNDQVNAFLRSLGIDPLVSQSQGDNFRFHCGHSPVLSNDGVVPL